MPESGGRPDARIGLVLGAGGVLGGAWMVGALNALWEETGWDPGLASHIVGTSAGSVLAAALSARLHPDRLLPASPDWIFKGLFGVDGELVLSQEMAVEGSYRKLLWGMPGSWRLAVSALRFDGHGPSVLRILSGILPQGFVSTAPIRETIRQLVPRGWTDHENCWIVACDYETGRRTAFGRPDVPVVPLSDAVAASCAIPGFYAPQHVGGHLYVDGGVHSMSNLDLLADCELDLVICLNPLSSDHRSGGWDPVERIADALRRLASRQLKQEAALLRRAGTEVILVQPGPEDLFAMGHNLMQGQRSRDVVEIGMRSVRAQLRKPASRRRLALYGLVREPEGSLGKAS